MRKIDGEAQAGLVDALRDLTSAILALTAAGTLRVQEGGGEAERQELRRIVRELGESLDEVEADNAVLRAENERLLASQGASPLSLGVPAPADGDDDLPALARENADLRDALARVQAEEAEMRSVIRALDSSRAWKVVSLYWSLSRRLRRHRPDSFRPQQP